jgi:glucose/mannose-6-phosphate isomerase
MSTLNNKDIYRQLDTEDMYHKIIHLPEHIHNAYLSPVIHTPKDFAPKPIKRVIFAGMGGSAISGDILQAAFAETLPINIFKDYNLPVIYPDDLFIACSYSGNTEETISCLKKALTKTPNIAAITSGGIVKDLLADKHLRVELPPGFPPRAAIGYLFFSLLVILEKFNICESQEAYVKSTIASLMMKAGALSVDLNADYNLSKQAAKEINGKIPLIYSSNPSLSPVAYRWKCQINENAKYPAFFHTFPEMNHNEIEAWENKHFNKGFIPIFLSDLEETADYKKRITFFKNLLTRENISYLDFYTEGSSYFEKAFSLIYLGDVISYYLAILQNVNPTTINFIMQLKDSIS